MTAKQPPVVLVILDGWGIAPDGPGNAVTLANTPHLDRLIETYPHATLRTSGEAVGLPDGQMGNSEVGHLNIGAGFIVYQWITRIDVAIRQSELESNVGIQAAFSSARGLGGTVHLMGLTSEGGVHSHVRHLKALVEAAKAAGVTDLLVHAFTDGRDTPPTSGAGTIGDLERFLNAAQLGRIATISGRYFAMDRDHRWERTEKAFNAIVHGKGPRATSAIRAINEAYAIDMTDEFIMPVVIPAADGELHHIGPNDSVVFFNFRSDRGRQLTESLAVSVFTGFDRGEYAVPQNITTLTTYDAKLPVEVAFPPHDVELPLARVISEAGLSQLHTAETEKYPHVTFFLNGGREDSFPEESRRLVPSPKVATYDLQPEMSAGDVCAGVVEGITGGEFDFIIVNFANADMVGHTGSIAAAVIAVETVDACVGQILDALATVDGVALITADHGNSEQMIDPKSGGPFTAHTTFNVPVILVTPEDHPHRHGPLMDNAVLSAIAPTVLDLLGVPIPPSMTSPSLLQGVEE